MANERKGLAGVQKGDTIIVEQFGWRHSDPTAVQECEVIAAGPKYVAVSNDYRPKRFHRLDGAEVTENVVRAWAYPTRADYEAHLERGGLLEEARKAVRDAALNRLTNDQLRALIALVRA